MVFRFGAARSIHEMEFSIHVLQNCTNLRKYSIKKFLMAFGCETNAELVNQHPWYSGKFIKTMTNEVLDSEI